MQRIEHEINNIEICEFYSVPRIVPRAIGKYRNSGQSFDFLTYDKQGNPWDFTKKEMRDRTRAYVEFKKPMFIIGSPPCDQFSIMQDLNMHKGNPQYKQRQLIEAKIH